MQTKIENEKGEEITKSNGSHHLTTRGKNGNVGSSEK